MPNSEVGYRKFKYGQMAVLKKGNCGITVKIGVKFDSKVKSSKNPSRVSYYIEGYSIRNWCFEEELREYNIIDRIFKGKAC